MIKITTKSYIAKTAFTPSLRQIVNKGVEGIRGVQKALNPIIGDTWMGNRGTSRMALDALQQGGFSEASEFARSIKNHMDSEFSQHIKDPSSAPGSMCRFMYEDIYCKVLKRRLTTNAAALAMNAATFNDFSQVVDMVFDFANAHGQGMHTKKIKTMIHAKDDYGNPLPDRDEKHKALIGVFGDWIPSYYNKAVDLVEAYNDANSLPRC
jgi:hypothetical protein